MNSPTPTGKSSNKLLHGIAFYQMIGGALGLLFAIQLGVQMESEASSSTLAIIIACLLYLFSILCGYLLLKNPAHKITLSMVNQVLQILSLGYGKFAFNYVAGVKLGVGLTFLESWLVKLRFSASSFQFTFNANSGPSFITVNIVAILLLYILEKAKDNLKSKP